jgi:hypothetical protein
MFMTKLAATAFGGIALGVLGSWAAAGFAVAVVATAVVFSQLRREVEELRAEVD